MNVLILDDHLLFNDGLKLQLETYPLIETIHQLYDGKELYEFLAKEKDIDILLLELKIDTLNGFDIADQISKRWPKIKKLVISVYAQIYQIDELKRVGIKGFVSKTDSIAEVYKAILKLIKGGEYFSNKKRVENKFSDDFTKKASLTKREVELIKLLFLGKSNPQIAEKLNLSIHTIVAHRKNIHVKLGVNNERDLIKFALQNGLE
jgi:DNA-binding NarL/FixJ family response regulator